MSGARERLGGAGGPAASLLAAICCLAAEAAAAAQPPGPGRVAGASGRDAGSAAQAAVEAAPGSPRESLATYLDLARDGRFDEAARYLSLSTGQEPRGPQLAARLKAVLDRHLWLDLDLVSALPEGDVGDGLPPAAERIGSLPGPSGAEQPVLLTRRSDLEEPRWLFSSGTVARVDAWYAGLGGRWLRERLPAVLLRPGPRDLLVWQWLALPLLVLAAWAGGRLLAWVSLSALGRIVARTRMRVDDVLLRVLRGPVAAAWALGLWLLLSPGLALYAPAHAFVSAVARAAGMLVVFWALWRCVDAAVELVRGSHWEQLGSSTRALLQIGERLAKILLLALALVAVLAALGYPVAGLLAGLGIGGLALALAAQKTVENLFGSLALALDRPFGVGDFVRVDDLVGTVEAIGLRSAQIRTLDRTLVTIPNGRLADMRLESFSARDRMRLACTVGLVYGTTVEQMRTVLRSLEQALRSHPLIWPDAVVVRFEGLGASSLDIEVMAWFETSVWAEFQLIRQEVLLRFMEVVEQAGTSFAFPTRTVHVVAETPRSGPPDRHAETPVGASRTAGGATSGGRATGSR
jgi:MscS family membrane protein